MKPAHHLYLGLGQVPRARGVRELLAHALREVSSPALATLPAGTLVVFGTHDRVVRPADVEARVREATLKVLAQPAVRERLSSDGTEVITNSPEEFAALIKADVALWAELVKKVGVRIE